MSKPLGDLLSDSWTMFQKYLSAILVAAAIFGAIGAFAQFNLAKQVQTSVEGMVMDELGMDPARIEELAMRAETGDETAAAELMEMMAGAGAQFDGMTEEQQALYMVGQMRNVFGQILPSLGLATLVLTLIALLAKIYYLVLALEGKDASKTASRVPGLFLPIVGLSIWIFLVTFSWLAWIPLLGWILPIVLGPRYVVAPILLIKENKGITESARMSYKATKNYWGKIFGNMIVVALLVIVVSFLINIPIALLGAVSVIGSLFLQAVIGQLAMAYCVIFSVHLAMTILKNPRKG